LSFPAIAGSADKIPAAKPPRVTVVVLFFICI
jgi:hypothetical protein